MAIRELGVPLGNQLAKPRVNGAESSSRQLDFDTGAIFEKVDSSFSLFRTATPSTLGSYGDPNAVSFITKVNASKYLVPYYYSNGSGYVTELKSISVTSSGITVSTNKHTIGTGDTRNFSCGPASGFMSGNDYVQLFCPNGNAAKVNVDTLSYSTVSSGFSTLNSATILSGSYAGQSFSYIGIVQQFTTGYSRRAVIDNGDGTGTVLVHGFVNGATAIVGFVYNASAVLVDSFVVVGLSNLPSLSSVIIAHYEKVNSKIVYYVSVTYSSNLVTFAAVFNTSDKTFVRYYVDTVTVSTVSISGLRVSTSKNSLQVETTVGLTSYACTFFLQDRIPFIPYTVTQKTSSTEKQNSVTGVPYIHDSGNVYMIGQTELSYSQSGVGVSSITSTNADSLGLVQIRPLITKYEEYSANSASGFKQFFASANVICSYLNHNDVTTVSGGFYSVNLIPYVDGVVDDSTFLAVAFDSNTTTNEAKIGFVFLRRKL